MEKIILLLTTVRGANLTNSCGFIGLAGLRLSLTGTAKKQFIL